MIMFVLMESINYIIMEFCNRGEQKVRETNKQLWSSLIWIISENSLIKVPNGLTAPSY